MATLYGMTEPRTGPGGTTTDRENAYPSDVGDAEWEFLAPFLTLMVEDAPQRKYPMRDLFNAIRYVVRGGIPWRMMPKDFPPWNAVYQQARISRPDAGSRPACSSRSPTNSDCSNEF